MTPRGELSIERAALPENVAPMRHAVSSFLMALGVTDTVRLDVVTALGEAVANVIEHAYSSECRGHVKVIVRLEEDATVTVAVIDAGKFVVRKKRPDRGFGLRIIRAVAHAFELDTQAGTTVNMRFRV